MKFGGIRLTKKRRFSLMVRPGDTAPTRLLYVNSVFESSQDVRKFNIFLKGGGVCGVKKILAVKYVTSGILSRNMQTILLTASQSP